MRVPAVVDSPAKQSAPCLLSLTAGWRYLNYSRQLHIRGDHFAGVRERVRAALAYNNAIFVARHFLSNEQRGAVEAQLAELGRALEE